MCTHTQTGIGRERWKEKEEEGMRKGQEIGRMEIERRGKEKGKRSGREKEEERGKRKGEYRRGDGRVDSMRDREGNC